MHDDDELPPAYMYRRLLNRTYYITNVNRDNIYNNYVKSNLVIVKAAIDLSRTTAIVNRRYLIIAIIDTHYLHGR